MSVFASRFVAVLGVSLLVSGGAFAYKCGNDLVNVQKRIETTRSLDDTDDGLSNIVLNAETGQRGFLLTGDESYLEPYYTAKTMLPGQLRFYYTLDLSPAQRKFADEIEPIIDAKMQELALTIRLRRERGAKAALEIVTTNAGRDAMGTLRRMFREQRVQSTRELGILRQAASALVKGTLSGLATMAIAVLMFWACSRGEAPKEKPGTGHSPV